MIVVTGANGQVGGWVVKALQERGLPVKGLGGRQRLDLLDDAAVESFLAQHEVGALIHCAALSLPRECFQEPELARALNGSLPARLWRILHRNHSSAYMIHVSTDMIFSGERGDYQIEEPGDPISVYGRSKWQGEQDFLAAGGPCVVRLANLFGFPITARKNFFCEQVEALARGLPLQLFTDERRSPLTLSAAARLLVDLVQFRWAGVCHGAGPTGVSRYEFGCLLAQALGRGLDLLRPVALDDAQLAEARPKCLTLSLAGNPACLDWLKVWDIEAALASEITRGV